MVVPLADVDAGPCPDQALPPHPQSLVPTTTSLAGPYPATIRNSQSAAESSGRARRPVVGSHLRADH
jgi:hypothetical protein